MKMLFLDGESISMKRESLFFTASEDDSGLVESLLNSWWSTRETRYIRLIIYTNPGRRKVNYDCREVPLSLGAVQHI